MSRLLVLGATGATGRLVVAQALDRGHRVTAVARRPEALDLRHPWLATIAIDLTRDAGGLEQALPGHDAVISTVGRGLSFRSDDLMRRATPAIITAMGRAGPRRLLYLSAYGVGGSAPLAHWTDRLFMGVMLRGIYADKAAGEAAVQASDLAWTILAPVRLTLTPAKGRFRIEPPQPFGPLSLPRADLATAILACLEDPATIRRRLVIAP